MPFFYQKIKDIYTTSVDYWLNNILPLPRQWHSNIHQCMKDWIGRLDNILQLNGRELLTHAGKISHKMALEKSNIELEKYYEASYQKSDW